ncbi:MAG: cupin domain-containing protein [Chitinophagales bacterium]
MKSIILKKSGETINFIRTGKDTQGSFAEIICTIPAGQKGPPTHIHPLQNENFGVMEGILELSAGGQKIVLAPGESFNVIANTAHTFSNPANRETKFRATYTPALNIDYFLVQSFDALNRLSNPGRPGLQLIVDFDYIQKQIPGQFVAAGVPAFVLTLFAGIGKLFKKHIVQSLEEHNRLFMQYLDY